MLQLSHPREVRAAIRSGRWAGRTADLVTAYVQTTPLIMPRAAAYDFLVFCHRNPRPCGLIDVTDPGETEVSNAPGSDIRTDMPQYRVWRNGELVDEVTDVSSIWRDDLVTFQLGCSLTFEGALDRAGIPFRPGRGVYTTDREAVPSGPFHSRLVVSMRHIPVEQATRATTVTARFPQIHGAPLHIGDPSALGIDLARADFENGDISPVPGRVPVFWACSVTAVQAAINARLDLLISIKPGYMFVSDTLAESIALP